jgi:hypothetical protein
MLFQDGEDYLTSPFSTTAKAVHFGSKTCRPSSLEPSCVNESVGNLILVRSIEWTKDGDSNGTKLPSRGYDSNSGSDLAIF